MEHQPDSMRLNLSRKMIIVGYLVSMQRKAVCHLTTVHQPFDTRIFHKECKTLTRNGYKVILIAQHERNEVVDGVRIIALPRPRNRFYRILGLTWRAFRLAVMQQAEVYHFHDPELLPAGVLLKIFTTGSVIYDVHEDVPQQILTKYWIPPFLRRTFAKIFNITEKLMARVFDGVVVATEGIAEKFARFNPIVIHNYPDLRMFPIQSPLPQEEKENILVYVGGISRLRGAFEMVHALESLDPSLNVHLDMIGRFEPSGLDKELQSLPGYIHVQFIGWLAPENVYVHLRKTILGLVCLHPEPRYIVSLPIKLFEYMAAGLPVIASNFPLWKDIVEGSHCGLCIDPLNSKEISKAIEFLLMNPEEARIMGENGRRAVEEKYNWEKEGEKLLTLYEELPNR